MSPEIRVYCSRCGEQLEARADGSVNGQKYTLQTLGWEKLTGVDCERVHYKCAKCVSGG
jgi:DNA-directed RNA polymerase subunit RPC12/RpoP